MNSFVFDIGGKAQKIALFVGTVHAELQRAWLSERKTRKLTQQSLATLLGVNRSVINRQIMGYENLTIRRVAELAWALGWEIEFSLKKQGSLNAGLPLPAATFSGAQEPPKLSEQVPLRASSTCNDNNRPVMVAA